MSRAGQNRPAAPSGETLAQLIVESSTDFAIITSDRYGVITSWNPGAEHILGWSEDEMVGKDGGIIFTLEDRERGEPKKEMETALREGRAEDRRWHLKKDGSRFWANGIMMPLRDSDAQGFLKILRDQTEQLQTAHNQTRRLEQMKALAEAARTITGAADLATLLQAITEAARDIIGAHQSVCSLTREPDWSQSKNAVAFLNKYGRWSDIATMQDDLGINACLREGSRTVRMTQAETEAQLGWRGLGEHAVERPPMRGCLATALVGSDGSNLGLIQLFDKVDGEFDEVDESIAVQLAQFAASGVERTQAEEERRTAEASAVASEAYIRLLLDSTTESFYAVSRDGTTTLCNAAFLKMLDFAREDDAIGRKLHDVIHHSRPNGAHYPKEECPIYLCARDGTPAHVTDELFFRLDGTSFPVEYWAHPIVRDGELHGAICTFADVSPQRAAQEKLHETAERYRLVARATNDAIWDWDLHTNEVVWNEAVQALFGHAEAVNGTSAAWWLEHIHPDDRARVETSIHAVIDGTGTSWSDEYRFTRAGGSYADILDRGTVLRDERGRPLRMIGAMLDLTERKRAEQVLREVNETLESRVAEAIAEGEKTQEQLRQAQKMEAVGQLTGGIAHDFNNLLTGVIGALDMMQRRISQDKTADLQRYTTAAMSAANRAAALTHRLLAFSRRQTLDPKAVNANRLVTGMEDLLRRTIGEAIRLEIVTAGGLWLTLCDPHQVENAILNLAINARDAMPNGGALTIETCNAHLDNAYAALSRDVRPGQYVCICVTDTGSGMSPDVMAKAFDPFFTTKPIGQGTGLGLSMIYGFARQSEGYAKIYSEVGKGTTIKLYLPRHYGEVEHADEEKGALTEAPRSEHGEIVLVVEDETVVRDLIVEVLEELGYRAVEAKDGPSGLKLLQSDMRVDLLITDVGLPGLNGRQVADAAREGRPGLKVLFMTGYAENAAIANGFLEPGMQMITKPFALDALASRIRHMIGSD